MLRGCRAHHLLHVACTCRGTLWPSNLLWSGLAQPLLLELQWWNGGFRLGGVHELSVDLPPLFAVARELRKLILQARGISNILLTDDGAAFGALGVVMVFALCCNFGSNGCPTPIIHPRVCALEICQTALGDLLLGRCENDVHEMLGNIVGVSAQLFVPLNESQMTP